jgi:beta-galactosidase
VGKGKLMVCAIDLDAAHVGTPSLKKSVLEYMASAAFQPKVQVTAEQMRASLTPKAAAGPAPKAAPTSPDLVDPGQIRQRQRPRN